MAVQLVVWLGLALATPAPAPEASPVGVRAVETARAAVMQRAREAGMEIVVDAVGPVPALSSQVWADAQLNALVPPERWLRPRLPVAVAVFHADGKRRTTVTVWLGLSVPMRGAVYSDDFARATAATQLRTQEAAVDLARTQGELPLSAPLPAAGRLRRAVRAGQPALASDLEAVPVVVARQRVGIEAVVNSVRLALQGTALTEGDVGQLIDVLPDHSQQPVKGRVVSHEVVRIER